ncbi:MAG: hypothetical protein EBX03_10410 [Rhodobacteraceae bacterium]|nr:hypothetical protein [Paracoccaceae bacterium]
MTNPDQISDKTFPEDMIFPLVAKAVSPDMPHKTEYGAIKLGLRDLAAVAVAYREIHDNCNRLAPDARIEGIMIEEYVADKILNNLLKSSNVCKAPKKQVRHKSKTKMKPVSTCGCC